MRSLVVSAALLLGACTLLVPIDDDVIVSAKADRGENDSGLVGKAEGGASEASASDAAVPAFDSGEPFGPAREGCPNGVLLDPEIEAYYPFDETEGSILHDCSQSGHDLETLTAAVPKWTEGHINGAGDFDGVDGCFGLDDHTVARFESEPFSISVWAQVRRYFVENNKTGRWIVSHKAGTKGWHVGADDPSKLELDLEWNEADSGKKTQISAVTAPQTWTHFAATYDPAKHEVLIYKDGVLAQKTSDADEIPDNFGTGDDVFLRVGCRDSKTNTFDGKIDELRIYPGVLTEAKIRKLAEAR